MKALVVEDDFASRKLLQHLLSCHGEVDVATNGIEAIEAYRMAIKENAPYQLICLDVMMPEMDGYEALKAIRSLEKEQGIKTADRTKIIMTTALEDPKSITQAFKEQCDYYLVKPIDGAKLEEQLASLGLLKDPVA